MKNLVYFILIFQLSLLTAHAQGPTWSVDESAYQFTMTFIAKLNIDGIQLDDPNDLVGAFVGNNCRGVTHLTYVESKAAYYAYLTVFSNSQDDMISFKIYDSSKSTITQINKTIQFNAGSNKGDLFQSYSIAQPPLKSGAELLSFQFVGSDPSNAKITEDSVTVNLNNSFDLSNLSPEFTLSEGATLYKNGQEQKSAQKSDDFTSEVTYSVLSEDESTLNTYSVVVYQNTFYKKDAVCYAGGAIKVVSNQEGALVELISDGNSRYTGTISNGLVEFTDLENTNYTVTIGSQVKKIGIKMITE